jgi:hypothetical protein
MMNIHSLKFLSLTSNRRSYRHIGVTLGAVVCTTAGWLGLPVLMECPSSQGLAQSRHRSQANYGYGQSTIIIHPPVVWPHPPRRTTTRERVRVVFEALGSDWGSVYLDGRLIYRAYNHNRQESIDISPGGYRLEITGVARADVWASGYLDVGRGDSHLLVIRFSKDNGVQVVGAPNVWVPDE